PGLKAKYLKVLFHTTTPEGKWRGKWRLQEDLSGTLQFSGFMPRMHQAEPEPGHPFFLVCHCPGEGAFASAIYEVHGSVQGWWKELAANRPGFLQVKDELRKNPLLTPSRARHMPAPRRP
ncbi:MAG: hypothetical protein SFV22_15370, partial [Saprospiraceae bacterium]|nr:hypothetical protein [Saprospiraceae bacterium]